MSLRKCRPESDISLKVLAPAHRNREQLLSLAAMPSARPQTLDRYLDIQTLPEKPRLKKVISTGEFVLSNAPAGTPLRRRLESALDQLKSLN